MQIVRTNKRIINMSHPSQIELNSSRPQIQIVPKENVVIHISNKQDKKFDKMMLKLTECIDKTDKSIKMEITNVHLELKVPQIYTIDQKIIIPQPINLPQQIKIEEKEKKQETNTMNILKQQLIQIKKCNEPIQLLLQENDQRKKYYSRAQREKEDIIHWGQRKLLISEIWFLTNYGSLSRNVIYAGAAPGIHINLLSDFFKNHHFYLYDPNEFHIKQGPKITIYQRCFTNEEACKIKELFQNDYLFISDIRTANYKSMTPQQNEQAVLKDNELQMEWINILKPQKAMLKFRCAYPTEIQSPTTFFEGDIYIQAWAPASSTETRLVPHDYTTKQYDNVKYEEQLFYHNDVVRKEKKGSLSWDERAETQILTDYVRNQGYGETQIKKQVNFIKDLITTKLNQM